MANMLIRYLHYLEYYTSTNSHSTNLASPTCTLAASFQKNLCGAQDKSVKISIRLASFRYMYWTGGHYTPGALVYRNKSQNNDTIISFDDAQRTRILYIYSRQSLQSHICVCGRYEISVFRTFSYRESITTAATNCCLNV